MNFSNCNRISFILMMAFLQICSSVVSQSSIINYDEDITDFANPERGFFHQRESGSASPSLLSSGDFSGLKSEKLTMIRRLYNMTTFRATPISDSFLKHIQIDMDAVRTNGCKVVLRFAYTFNEDPPHNDAPLSIILSHIDQLTPILEKNYDVIAFMEAGFIGRWGEWHTSSNNLDNTADMKSVLLKILTALPKSRSVAVRYQQRKKDIFNTSVALTDAESFNETDKSRTGHFNDCLCASTNDWGTYMPVDEASINIQKNYLNAENRFLPQGGETCNVSPPRSDCTQAVADLVRMRWSTLNDDYHKDVLSSWKTQNCYSDIKLKLGYRFRLVQATIPNSTDAGTDLKLSFIVRNDGYASPYNSRDLELVLRSKLDGVVTRFKIDNDPRKWLPENGNITIDVNVTIPADFVIGEYDVLLNLPDPAPLLNSKKEYSIRLANKNTWEDKTGYNNLLTSIIINSRNSVRAFESSNNLLKNLLVFPNPANESASVSCNLLKNSVITINICDSYGRLILPIENISKIGGTYQSIIDLSKISGGTYFINFNVNGMRYVKQLIVVKC